MVALWLGIVFDCSYTLDIYEKQKVNIKKLQATRLNGSFFAFFNLNSVKIAQKSDENWRFEGKSVNFLGKTLAKIKNMCYNN